MTNERVDERLDQFCGFLKQRGLDLNREDTETARRLAHASVRGTKVMRLPQVYGRGNPLGIGKTKFFLDVLYREGGDEHIPGTNIPRLRVANLGKGLLVAFEDEVHRLIEALRAERDAELVRSGGSTRGKQAEKSAKQHQPERAKAKPAAKERMTKPHQEIAAAP